LSFGGGEIFSVRCPPKRKQYHENWGREEKLDNTQVRETSIKGPGNESGGHESAPERNLGAMELGGP